MTKIIFKEDHKDFGLTVCIYGCLTYVARELAVEMDSYHLNQ